MTPIGSDGAGTDWTATRLAATLPPTVMAKITTSGAGWWLDRLPDLIAEMADRWDLRLGSILGGGTEAFVAEATQADGTPAVLKLLVPHDDEVDAEITAFTLHAALAHTSPSPPGPERGGHADDDGWARMLASDRSRAALLIERLGAPMNELGIAGPTRRDILCDVAHRAWRPVTADALAAIPGLPTGAEKAARLAEMIPAAWDELGRPCEERAIDHAVAVAERRRAAHDDERSMLLHGDVHQWNALSSDRGFKLVDPDGLIADPAYELGVLMREDPDELPDSAAVDARAHHLAARAGLDATAIDEWGVIERVSTGLVATRIDLQPEGRRMLAVADRLAADRGW